MRAFLGHGLQWVMQWVLVALAACAFQSGAAAEPVAAKHLEGTVHGFLTLTDSDGKVVASGDLVEIVRGDRVTSNLHYRFKDGSVDDETTVFTQRGTFKLISDRHIQKGPFFPHPIDLTIDATSGQVTVRSVDKDGKEKVDSTHMDLPPDLYNGLVASIVKNVPDAQTTTVSMLVTTPKPRLVKLAISGEGEDAFSIGGMKRKATAYLVKIELGGVTGIVAPLVGKAPPDIHLWVAGGKVPEVVREEAPIFDDGPILGAWMASPVWPHKTAEAGK